MAQMDRQMWLVQPPGCRQRPPQRRECVPRAPVPMRRVTPKQRVDSQGLHRRLWRLGALAAVCPWARLCTPSSLRPVWGLGPLHPYFRVGGGSSASELRVPTGHPGLHATKTLEDEDAGHPPTLT